MASLLRSSIAQNQDRKEQLELELRKEEDRLRDIENGPDFFYEVEERTVSREKTEPGMYAINCSICFVTCHKNCTVSSEKKISQCQAMDDKGRCKVCPENCDWSSHRKESHVIIIRNELVRKSGKDLKRGGRCWDCIVGSINFRIEEINKKINADKRTLNQMKLNERHLLQVSERITDETRRTKLGLNLRVPDFQIATTKLNHPNDFTMANYDNLKKWFLTTTDRIDAWEELENALQKCNLNQIVAEVLTLKEI